MGLSNRELADMRGALANLMPSEARVYTYAATVDAAGNAVDSYTAGITYNCRLDWRNGRETVTADALAGYTGWVVTLPYDAALTVKDRLLIGGKYYSVTSFDTDKSWGIVARALVEQV
jgi:hypothetical protein